MEFTDFRALAEASLPVQIERRAVQPEHIRVIWETIAQFGQGRSGDRRCRQRKSIRPSPPTGSGPRTLAGGLGSRSAHSRGPGRIFARAVAVLTRSVSTVRVVTRALRKH